VEGGSAPPVGGPPPPQAGLSLAARNFARAGVSPDTQRKYRAAWSAFCAAHADLDTAALTDHERDVLLVNHLATIRQERGDDDPGTYYALNVARCAVVREWRLGGYTPGGTLRCWMRDALAVLRPRPSVDWFFDLRPLLDYLVRSASASSEAELRARLVVALRIFTMRRSGDLAGIVASSVRRMPPGFVFQMWNTKEARGLSTPVPLLALPDSRDLCPARALQRYIDRTAARRQAGLAPGDRRNRLLLNLRIPVGLGADAISNIAAGVMEDAGVPLSDFSPHHLRGASASLLLARGVDVHEVMRIGGWRSLGTLTRFYARVPASQALMAAFTQAAPDARGGGDATGGQAGGAHRAEGAPSLDRASDGPNRGPEASEPLPLAHFPSFTAAVFSVVVCLSE
jgi:integrase